MDGIISREFYNDLSSIIKSSRKSARLTEYLSFETGYLVNVLPRKNFRVHMLTDMVKRLFLNWHGHSQSSTGKALTSDLYIFMFNSIKHNLRL